MWYLLVTDIGGRVYAAIDNHNSDAIKNADLTVLDLLLVIQLVQSLTGTLIRKIVPTIVSRLAKRTTSNGLRELTAKEASSIRQLTRKELTYVGGGRPLPALADNSDIIGGGLTNDVRLAQIYLKSPEVQREFAVLEKELIQRESLGSGLSAPPPPTGPFRVGNTIRGPSFNPPRVVVGGQVSKSAQKFKALSKVSATLQHEEHIKLVMKKAMLLVREEGAMSPEFTVAYDILMGAFDPGKLIPLK